MNAWDLTPCSTRAFCFRITIVTFAVVASSQPFARNVSSYDPFFGIAFPVPAKGRRRESGTEGASLGGDGWQRPHQCKDS